MTRDDWLKLGWDNRWCGPPVCSTCDGVPFTEDEIEMGDCVYVLRLYEAPEMAEAVEADHSPSQWRASNLGWTHPPVPGG